MPAFLSQVNEQGSFSFSCADKNFGIIKIKKRYHESILMGDFLGDGKQSILLQAGENDGTDSKLIYITFSSGVFTAIELPLSMLLDVERMFACDFNGDGISEIYYSNNENNVAITGLKRMRKSNSGYYYEDINNNMLSPWHQLFPGDFNGDGKLDLLSYVEDGAGNGGWHIQYFKESELSWPAFSISNQTMGIGNPGNHGYSLKNLSEPTYQFISVGDFNGDGKSDIAVRTSGSKMRFLYAPLRMEDGEAKFASVQNVSLSDMGMGGVSNQNICTGNFLGHENLSMFSGGILYSLNPLTNRYSVRGIVDGMGNCNKFRLRLPHAQSFRGFRFGLLQTDDADSDGTGSKYVHDGHPHESPPQCGFIQLPMPLAHHRNNIQLRERLGAQARARPPRIQENQGGKPFGRHTTANSGTSL